MLCCVEAAWPQSLETFLTTGFSVPLCLSHEDRASTGRVWIPGSVPGAEPYQALQSKSFGQAASCSIQYIAMLHDEHADDIPYFCAGRLHTPQHITSRLWGL